MSGNSEPRVVRSWIGFHARSTPDKVALQELAGGRRFTYAGLDRRIGAVAAVLADRYGIGHGDRVAMAARNCAAAFELMYACAHLGAIFVPLNIRLADPELGALVGDAEPKLIAGERDQLGRQFGISLRRWDWDSDYETALGAARPREAAQVGVDEPWAIIYTSGTTGRSKGVVVTHAGSEATMLAGVLAAQLGAQSVSLTVLPLWHVAGLNLFANPTLFVGGTVLLMRSFEPEQTLQLLARERDPVTHFAGVPANYQFIQALPGFEQADFGQLTASVGAAPVPVALLESWSRRGVQLRAGYGCTEAGSTVAMMAPGGVPSGAGDVGIPMWHLRARVMAEGAECAPGEPGELQLAGTSVTPGYWNRPEETADAIVDGWLRTGDVATIGADGHLTIVDRIKDMYVSGGENVYPAEVENVLYRHPAVAQAAVVGVPDGRWGQSGIAWVVLHEAMPITSEALREWTRTQLAGYKVPREFRQVEQLPRNATGKVLKASLREQAAAERPTYAEER